MIDMPRLRKKQGLARMPVWQHRHRNAITWKVCVDILQDRCFEKTPVADIGWQHPLPAKDSLP